MTLSVLVILSSSVIANVTLFVVPITTPGVGLLMVKVAVSGPSDAASSATARFIDPVVLSEEIGMVTVLPKFTPVKSEEVIFVPERVT
jgi:hypothetical protein